MQYDIGYFDLDACRVEPLENPFGPKVLTINPSSQTLETRAVRPIPMKQPLRLAILRIYARRIIVLKSYMTILRCLAYE